MKNIATRLSIYSYVLVNSVTSNGLMWTIKKASFRVLKELLWLALLPLSISMHLLGVRRLLIRLEHIGHLAAEPDAFIKEGRLRDSVPNNRFYFILAPKSQVSNQHLLNYWRPHFRIIENTYACYFLSLMSRRVFMRTDVSRYISTFFGTQEIYGIYRAWGDRPPVLKLNADDAAWARAVLPELGVPNGKWYVCLHVREGGYLPHNELIQSHRNASVENVLPAIEEIISRGGVVIRMGDASMTPLPAMEGVIDYAHHPLKSARMDVVLCAQARFFLGCTSGLSFVSTIFGVPVVNVNMIPVQALGVGPNDISIPKLLWSESENKYLSFDAVLSQPVGGYYFTNQYTADNVTPVENTATDILGATQEMLDRLDGNFQLTDQELSLHAYYMGLFNPGHYGYGAASRVGVKFLTDHVELLNCKQ